MVRVERGDREPWLLPSKLFHHQVEKQKMIQKRSAKASLLLQSLNHTAGISNWQWTVFFSLVRLHFKRWRQTHNTKNKNPLALFVCLLGLLQVYKIYILLAKKNKTPTSSILSPWLQNQSSSQSLASWHWHQTATANQKDSSVRSRQMPPGRIWCPAEAVNSAKTQNLIKKGQQCLEICGR